MRRHHRSSAHRVPTEVVPADARALSPPAEDTFAEATPLVVPLEASHFSPT